MGQPNLKLPVGSPRRHAPQVRPRLSLPHSPRAVVFAGTIPHEGRRGWTAGTTAPLHTGPAPRARLRAARLRQVRPCSRRPPSTSSRLRRRGCDRASLISWVRGFLPSLLSFRRRMPCCSATSSTVKPLGDREFFVVAYELRVVRVAHRLYPLPVSSRWAPGGAQGALVDGQVQAHAF